MINKEALIFEVSKNNFDSAVIENSHKVPVLVEFMGVWSGPCIQMSEEIISLANEFGGEFIFAKVDMDEQPELIKQYAIDNVPALRVFKNGEVVRSEEGQLKQEELRAVLKDVDIYSRSDELRLQAREQHMSGNTVTAIQLLTQAMQQDSSNVKVAMDMVQIFIDVNELEQATGLFNQLPDSAKNSDMGKQLIGQITFLDLAAKTVGESELRQTIMVEPDNCDAHFDLALCLVAVKDYTASVDALMTILSINSDYKAGAAREMIINIANMLAPNNSELAASFRRRLGAL